jgi:hypothetical protein
MLSEVVFLLFEKDLGSSSSISAAYPNSGDPNLQVPSLLQLKSQSLLAAEAMAQERRKSSGSFMVVKILSNSPAWQFCEPA